MTVTESTLIAHCGASKVDRGFLKSLPLPDATRTHKPVSHYELVCALTESLSFRHITVTRDEYAVTADGMRMFGLLELNHGFIGCNFAIGIRNSNDKSLKLAMTVGYRVLVCDNMAFKGDFTPVIAKHSKKLNLIDLVSVGVDRIQRSFDPLKAQANSWRSLELEDRRAKEVIYDAFLDSKLGVPRTILSTVHRLYFRPELEEFAPRTLWSLSNAFTSAFKELKPIKQFQVTARLNDFLERYRLPA